MSGEQKLRVALKTLPVTLAVKAAVLLGCGYLARTTGVSSALVGSLIAAAFLGWNLPMFARRSNRARTSA